MKKDRDRKISWHAFDPTYQLWQPLPPIPKEYSEALGFGCAVLSGCHLYLFGGKDPVKGSMRRVIFYSARTNKWRRAPDMLRRRQFFGCCVINNCLYVAGGENEGIHRSLRSAEVYDPNKNRWSFISDMSTAMVPIIGVVYEGKWFLKGLGSHRQVLTEVYQPETDSWCSIHDGMVAGWRSLSTTVNGHLYALDCKDGCKLQVYDEATGSWSKQIDGKMHLGNSKALEAAALLPLNGKLCIIRNNMSISLVDVLKSDHGSSSTDEHLWETIAGKGHFKTLMTNFLSNLPGRNRFKSHIVHCQVLHA
ncbi:F-box/kelch-repeat protein At1g55270-like [Olea europaea var. sylvestris]|nr:F-box/kelch-repeat protein At1g55270-like [Olea europaea var. sylvestris]XP_022870026.1 F-box/kelch-repeat protein At1g55270-like [Olea europaea var. sylvestris]